MVLVKTQKLLTAGGRSANADSLDTVAWWGRIIGRSSLLAGWLSGVIWLPAWAALPPESSDTASLLPVLSSTPKGAHIDKSTRQFDQVHFEQRRREAAQFRQFQLEQTRIERLRRLQAHLRQSASQLDLAYSHSSAPITDRPVDGIYLYGQQPIPDQLATAYFVFESQGGSITGAFYMPSSSFDCVQGQMEPEQILLRVTDSYSQETSPYALSLDAPAAVVASQPVAVNPPLNISGFYRLPMSDQGRELLAICQARYL